MVCAGYGLSYRLSPYQYIMVNLAWVMVADTRNKEYTYVYHKYYGGLEELH